MSNPPNLGDLSLSQNLGGMHAELHTRNRPALPQEGGAQVGQQLVETVGRANNGADQALRDLRDSIDPNILPNAPVQTFRPGVAPQRQRNLPGMRQQRNLAINPDLNQNQPLQQLPRQQLAQPDQSLQGQGQGGPIQGQPGGGQAIHGQANDEVGGVDRLNNHNVNPDPQTSKNSALKETFWKVVKIAQPILMVVGYVALVGAVIAAFVPPFGMAASLGLIALCAVAWGTAGGLAILESKYGTAAAAAEQKSKEDHVNNQINQNNLEHDTLKAEQKTLSSSYKTASPERKEEIARKFNENEEKIEKNRAEKHNLQNQLNELRGQPTAAATPYVKKTVDSPDSGNVPPPVTRDQLNRDIRDLRKQLEGDDKDGVKRNPNANLPPLKELHEKLNEKKIKLAEVIEKEIGVLEEGLRNVAARGPEWGEEQLNLIDQKKSEARQLQISVLSYEISNSRKDYEGITEEYIDAKDGKFDERPITKEDIINSYEREFLPSAITRETKLKNLITEEIRYINNKPLQNIEEGDVGTLRNLEELLDQTNESLDALYEATILYQNREPPRPNFLPGEEPGDGQGPQNVNIGANGVVRGQQPARPGLRDIEWNSGNQDYLAQLGRAPQPRQNAPLANNQDQANPQAGARMGQLFDDDASRGNRDFLGQVRSGRANANAPRPQPQGPVRNASGASPIQQAGQSVGIGSLGAREQLKNLANEGIKQIKLKSEIAKSRGVVDDAFDPNIASIIQKLKQPPFKEIVDDLCHKDDNFKQEFLMADTYQEHTMRLSISSLKIFELLKNAMEAPISEQVFGNERLQPQSRVQQVPNANVNAGNASGNPAIQQAGQSAGVGSDPLSERAQTFAELKRLANEANDIINEKHGGDYRVSDPKVTRIFDQINNTPKFRPFIVELRNKDPDFNNNFYGGASKGIAELAPRLNEKYNADGIHVDEVARQERRAMLYDVKDQNNLIISSLENKRIFNTEDKTALANRLKDLKDTSALTEQEKMKYDESFRIASRPLDRITNRDAEIMLDALKKINSDMDRRIADIDSLGQVQRGRANAQPQQQRQVADPNANAAGQSAGVGSVPLSTRKEAFEELRRLANEGNQLVENRNLDNDQVKDIERIYHQINNNQDFKPIIDKLRQQESFFNDHFNGEAHGYWRAIRELANRVNDKSKFTDDGVNIAERKEQERLERIEMFKDVKAENEAIVNRLKSATTFSSNDKTDLINRLKEVKDRKVLTIMEQNTFSAAFRIAALNTAEITDVDCKAMLEALLEINSKLGNKISRG